MPEFAIVFIELVCVIIQISLCWLSHSLVPFGFSCELVWFALNQLHMAY
jgi:hypothetical protein